MTIPEVATEYTHLLDLITYIRQASHKIQNIVMTLRLKGNEKTCFRQGIEKLKYLQKFF